MRLAAFAFFATIFSCTAQDTRKIELDFNIDGVGKGYYLAIVPKGEIQGTIVLLGGYGEAPENVLRETKIHTLASENNFLTVVLSVGARMYADEKTVAAINSYLADTIHRYKVNKESFVFGGMSAGGTLALRYAELCHETPLAYPVVPKAVFAVDSPVDLSDLWAYFDREITRNFSDVGMNEARFIQGELKRELGGSPQDARPNFVKNSPFDIASKQPGNEKFLKNIPVRSYHDPDLVWYLQNRRRGVLDTNVACASELIARLMLMGNDKAELMISHGTGYRANGARHPHSWSIVNETELITWVKAAIGS
jgi:hypothetical protein